MAASTTPRKRAPRKTAAATAAPTPPEQQPDFDPDEELAKLFGGPEGPIAEDGSIRPVEIGKRGRTPNPMVDLFTLDGGKSYYQVPAKPPAMLAFRYQEQLRKCLRIKNPVAQKAAMELATREMFVALLGQDALDALAESPEVTDEDVEDIFGAIAHLCFGKKGVVTKVEEAQGN
jgi:hypothetical protein